MKLTYTKIPVKIKNKEISVVIPDNIDGFFNNQVIFDADRKGFKCYYDVSINDDTEKECNSIFSFAKERYYTLLGKMEQYHNW